MQTRFNPFSNIRLSSVVLPEVRRIELSNSSFIPVSRLQINPTEPLTNQPYGAYSKLNSSYVVQSLASQSNKQSIYVRPNLAPAFSRYEQAINPFVVNQPMSRFAYSIPANMPVHEATPSLVRMLSQYKKLPDDKQNLDITARLNFLLALSRSWFLIRNKLPLLANQINLKNDVDLMLQAVSACFKGKETGFAAKEEQELAPIFKQLDEILCLMDTHNIRFSEEKLNQFILDNHLFPISAAVAPVSLVQPTAQAGTSIDTKKYPQLDSLMQKHLKDFNGSLKSDLNRIHYEICIDDRNVFSTKSVFEPTLAAIKSVKIKFLKGSDSESSGDEELSSSAASRKLEDEEYINVTKRQVLDKIKAACSVEQFNLVKQLACQNIITFLLNYETLLKTEGLENETIIKNLCGLELGNVVRSHFDIHCNTHTKEVTLKVSFNNHLISKDKDVAEKVKLLLNMMDDFTHEAKERASCEFKLDLALVIKASGEVTCQDIRITEGKKIIN